MDDDKFADNVKACENAHIPWGVYHVIDRGNLDANKSGEIARHVLELIAHTGYEPQLPVFFDLEAQYYQSGYTVTQKGYTLRDEVVSFCDVIRQKYDTGIYTSESLLIGNYGLYQFINDDNYYCWPSMYVYSKDNGEKPEKNPFRIKNWTQPNDNKAREEWYLPEKRKGYGYELWQYTQRGVIAGNGSKLCDFDYWYGPLPSSASSVSGREADHQEAAQVENGGEETQGVDFGQQDRQAAAEEFCRKYFTQWTYEDGTVNYFAENSRDAAQTYLAEGSQALNDFQSQNMDSPLYLNASCFLEDVQSTTEDEYTYKVSITYVAVQNDPAYFTWEELQKGRFTSVFYIMVDDNNQITDVYYGDDGGTFPAGSDTSQNGTSGGAGDTDSSSEDGDSMSYEDDPALQESASLPESMSIKELLESGGVHIIYGASIDQLAKDGRPDTVNIFRDGTYQQYFMTSASDTSVSWANLPTFGEMASMTDEEIADMMAEKFSDYTDGAYPYAIEVDSDDTGNETVREVFEQVKDAPEYLIFTTDRDGDFLVYDTNYIGLWNENYMRDPGTTLYLDAPGTDGVLTDPED